MQAKAAQMPAFTGVMQVAKLYCHQPLPPAAPTNVSCRLRIVSHRAGGALRRLFVPRRAAAARPLAAAAVRSPVVAWVLPLHDSRHEARAQARVSPLAAAAVHASPAAVPAAALRGPTPALIALPAAAAVPAAPPISLALPAAAAAPPVAWPAAPAASWLPTIALPAAAAPRWRG